MKKEMRQLCNISPLLEGTIRFSMLFGKGNFIIVYRRRSILIMGVMLEDQEEIYEEVSKKDPRMMQFKFPSYSDAFLKEMQHLYHNQEMCDITLVVGNQRIQAHLLVLIIGSPYFRGMFSSNLKEAINKEAEFNGMNPIVFRKLIDYCYMGTLQIDIDTVEEFLTISHLLLMDTVTKWCCEYLEKCLDPSNCLGIKSIADTHGLDDLSATAQSYLISNFVEVSQEEEFLKLTAEEVKSLIQLDELNVDSEEEVLNAVLGWLHHLEDDRAHYAIDLLSHVRLPYLGKKSIFNTIYTNTLFANNMDCLKMTMEALQFQDDPQARPTINNLRSRPRCSYRGTIYVVCEDIAYYLEPKETSWSVCPNLYRLRPFSSMISTNGWIYSCGGKEEMGSSKCFERFSPAINYWVAKESMKEARRAFGITILNGSIYVAGGIGPSGRLKSVERESSNGWKHMPAMKFCRANYGIAVLNNKLYVVGGEDEQGEHRMNGEKYDPITNAWTSIASLQKPRSSFGLVEANGYLYAVGGLSYTQEGVVPSCLSSVERYDPSTDKWTEVSSLIIPCDSAGVVFYNRKIYCIGGATNDDILLQIVQVYDPSIDKWIEGVPLPEALEDPSVFIHCQKKKA